LTFLKAPQDASSNNSHDLCVLRGRTSAYLEPDGQDKSAEVKVYHHQTAERQDTERCEVELKQIGKKPADLEIQFLNELDGLLKRMVLTKQEFAKANGKARSEKAELETLKVELSNQVKQARASEALVEKVPRVIKTFMEAFQSLEPR
jgi:hypothetical protein